MPAVLLENATKRIEVWRVERKRLLGKVHRRRHKKIAANVNTLKDKRMAELMLKTGFPQSRPIL